MYTPSQPSTEASMSMSPYGECTGVDLVNVRTPQVIIANNPSKRRGCHVCGEQKHMAVECPYGKPHPCTLRPTHCGDHEEAMRRQYINWRDSLPASEKYEARYYSDRLTQTDPEVVVISQDDEETQDSPPPGTPHHHPQRTVWYPPATGQPLITPRETPTRRSRESEDIPSGEDQDLDRMATRLRMLNREASELKNRIRDKREEMERIRKERAYKEKMEELDRKLEESIEQMRKQHLENIAKLRRTYER